MNDFIPYGRQDLDESDISAVLEVLRSDWLTQGPRIGDFERAVATYCGSKHAVAVASGTAALHIACAGMDLGPGDILWTSPNTFIASANCGRYCGPDVDFVDINPMTYNMDVAALEEKLVAARKSGKLPKIVVPVHFAGQSCEMARVRALSHEFGFKVLEDGAHTIGGLYKHTKIGDCAYSDAVTLSFHPVKIVTTGEGGIVLANDDKLYERLLRLRNHGMTRVPEHMIRKPDGPWYYEQLELGYHYRITDIQAVLGLSQMKRIDVFTARRRELASRYDELLARLPVLRPWQHPDTLSAYHLYPVRLRLDEIQKTHREVFCAMQEARIGVNLHYIPVYLQPYYAALGFKKGYCPNAEKYYSEAITLPLYYRLTDEMQDRVVDTLKKILVG